MRSEVLPRGPPCHSLLQAALRQQSLTTVSIPPFSDPMASIASQSHSEHSRQLFAIHFHIASGLTAANAVRS
jgi:hypothetical protein